MDMKDYRQGLGQSENDVKKEFVDCYTRPKSMDDYSDEYARIMERKFKRIEEQKAKKKLEDTWQHGYDRRIKTPYTNGQLGYADRTHLPMGKLPEQILYEQTGKLMEPLKPWRCPKCGTLHMKAVPEYWDTFENRIRCGCSFCHERHPFDSIDYKRL